jgi:hypothetical protein
MVRVSLSARCFRPRSWRAVPSSVQAVPARDAEAARTIRPQPFFGRYRSGGRVDLGDQRPPELVLRAHRRPHPRRPASPALIRRISDDDRRALTPERPPDTVAPTPRALLLAKSRRSADHRRTAAETSAKTARVHRRYTKGPSQVYRASRHSRAFPPDRHLISGPTVNMAPGCLLVRCAVDGGVVTCRRLHALVNK